MLIDSDTIIKLGEDNIVKAYLGESVVYENASPTPTPYTELEYLESTGTQYIDTNYYANGNTKYEVKFSDSIIAGVVFGAYNSSWQSGSGFYHNYRSTGTNAKEWFHYYSNTQLDFDGTSGEETVILDKNKIYINGNLITQITGSVPSIKTFELNYPMYLFCGNMRGEIEQPVSLKLYYYKIYDDGVLVRDFIPVLDSNNVPCLYDKVSQTFFYNAGTGDFLYGTLDQKPEFKY